MEGRMFVMSVGVLVEHSESVMLVKVMGSGVHIGGQVVCVKGGKLSGCPMNQYQIMGTGL